MADRYQDRPFPSQDSPGAGRGDSDPLAELARLIGQADPFAAAPKASAQPSAPPLHPLQSRANIQPRYDDLPEEDVSAAPSPPSWMQRARTSAPPLQEPVYQQGPAYQYEEPEYEQPAPVHPLHRYAAQQPPAPAQEYYDDAPQQQPGYGAPHYAGAQAQHEPARYDDALYGRQESGEQDYQRDPAYPDDPYAYQNEYAEEPEPKKRSSGLVTVAAVLALAVVGTGAAFGYRTYVGSPRSGEPPIIKADNSPTKLVPAPSDAATSKNPDRMVPGDGGEKLVSREERPVDLNARSGPPRVVFPPLNQNGSPPPVTSVTPSGPVPAGGANGTLPNNEPRKIKTLAVRGDAAENGGVPPGVAPPAARPAPPAPRAAAPAAPARNPASANASANAPMSLSPQGAPEPAPGAPTRVAATNPTQTAPAAASDGGGSYLVSITSQDTEAAAKESYRSAQGKYASVLGSRSPVIKRVDMADGKVKYRAMVGPYRTRQEAIQFCGELKAAGGQCFIP